MIEKRRPKFRRRGEKDGKFHWGTILNIFVMLSVVAAISYVSFGLGRHYETLEREKKAAVDQSTLYKEYKSYRVGSHK
jgi:hypothetical protein